MHILSNIDVCEQDHYILLSVVEQVKQVMKLKQVSCCHKREALNMLNTYKVNKKYLAKVTMAFIHNI
jgi:hypothetical protein